MAQVLEALEQHQGAGEGVEEALSYYTTHQGRMDYAAYRARGLQIGSGSVESGCKQLVRARLKGAGMIWDAEGAEQVAVVRAWLQRGRWEEAMGLRRAPGRGYERKGCRAEAAENRAGVDGEQVAAAAEPAGRGLAPEVLAQVRAEKAHERQQHPWRRPWSRKQQRAHSEERVRQARPAAAA